MVETTMGELISTHCLTTTLRSRYYYNSHFTENENEARHHETFVLFPRCAPSSVQLRAVGQADDLAN